MRRPLALCQQDTQITPGTGSWRWGHEWKLPSACGSGPAGPQRRLASTDDAAFVRGCRDDAVGRLARLAEVGTSAPTPWRCRPWRACPSSSSPAGDDVRICVGGDDGAELAGMEEPGTSGDTAHHEPGCHPDPGWPRCRRSRSGTGWPARLTPSKCRSENIRQTYPSRSCRAQRQRGLPGTGAGHHAMCPLWKCFRAFDLSMPTGQDTFFVAKHGVRWPVQAPEAAPGLQGTGASVYLRPTRPWRSSQWSPLRAPRPGGWRLGNTSVAGCPLLVHPPAATR